MRIAIEEFDKFVEGTRNMCEAMRDEEKNLPRHVRLARYIICLDEIYIN